MSAAVVAAPASSAMRRRQPGATPMAARHGWARWPRWRRPSRRRAHPASSSSTTALAFHPSKQQWALRGSWSPATRLHHPGTAATNCRPDGRAARRRARRFRRAAPRRPARPPPSPRCRPRCGTGAPFGAPDSSVHDGVQARGAVPLRQASTLRPGARQFVGTDADEVVSDAAAATSIQGAACTASVCSARGGRGGPRRAPAQRLDGAHSC